MRFTLKRLHPSRCSLGGWGGAVLLAAVVGDGGDEERREGREEVEEAEGEVGEGGDVEDG